MGEGPDGVREVRDSTGFVVGSPDWLEVQRRIERRETSSGLQRQGMWFVVFGAIIIAISVFTTLTIVTSDSRLGLRLTPTGFVAVCVVPLLIGGYAIVTGLRRRGGGSKDVVTLLPPGARAASSASVPHPEADPTERS